MESANKACSLCNKFKSLSEFYKQGDRHESLCKECKKSSRGKRDASANCSEKSKLTSSITSKNNTACKALQDQGPSFQRHEREIVPKFDESIFYPEEERRAQGISDDDMDSIIAYFRWQMDQREKRQHKKEEVEI